MSPSFGYNGEVNDVGFECFFAERDEQLHKLLRSSYLHNGEQRFDCIIMIKNEQKGTSPFVFHAEILSNKPPYLVGKSRQSSPWSTARG